MKKQQNPFHLSKRERQIMDIIYERGRATAVEIHQNLADPASYSAVRGILRVLEEKNIVTHTQKGKRNLYSPVVATEKAGRNALEKLIKTFFSGSTEKAVATLIDISRSDLSQGDLDRLSALIDKAREEGR